MVHALPRYGILIIFLQELRCIPKRKKITSISSSGDSLSVHVKNATTMDIESSDSDDSDGYCNVS